MTDSLAFGELRFPKRVGPRDLNFSQQYDQEAPPGESLNGLMWLLPFTGPDSVSSRTCPPSMTTSTTMNGISGATYSVTLWFKGVVEQKTYTGGSNDGAYWQVGGTPAVDVWNIYKLEISNPSQTYYLNKGTSPNSTCDIISYQKTLSVVAGATVTLTATSVDNLENYHTLSVPDVYYPRTDLGSQPYAGQWVQMTVANITRIS